jgi:hypothetical protein
MAARRDNLEEARSLHEEALAQCHEKGLSDILPEHAISRSPMWRAFKGTRACRCTERV